MLLNVCSLRPSTLVSYLLFIFLSQSVSALPSVDCTMDPSYPGHLMDGRVHTVQVETSGWLMIEASSPAGSPVWFEVRSVDCRSHSGNKVVEQGFGHGILQVEPGRLDIHFGSVRPGGDDDLRLRTQFVGALHGLKDGEEEDDTDTGAAEILPKDKRSPGTPRPDKDGEEGDDDEEDDTDTGAAEILPVQQFFDPLPWLGCLDAAEPFDDFGLCAKSLTVNRSIMARLGEYAASDRDYYTFTLTRAEWITVQARGDVDLFVQLWTEDGRTLGRAAGSAKGDTASSMNLQARLPAGTYLVSIDSPSNASGDYRLELQGRSADGRR